MLSITDYVKKVFILVKCYCKLITLYETITADLLFIMLFIDEYFQVRTCCLWVTPSLWRWQWRPWSISIKITPAICLRINSATTWCACRTVLWVLWGNVRATGPWSNLPCRLASTPTPPATTGRICWKLRRNMSNFLSTQLPDRSFS